MAPSSNAGANGPTLFWGYALQANQSMRLEAQRLDGTWVEVARGTAVARPTYAGTRTGYYWELTGDPKTIASQFRRPSGGTYTVFYRITSPNLSPAETQSCSPSPSATGDFDQLWSACKTDGVIRLTVF